MSGKIQKNKIEKISKIHRAFKAFCNEREDCDNCKYEFSKTMEECCVAFTLDYTSKTRKTSKIEKSEV